MGTDHDLHHLLSADPDPVPARVSVVVVAIFLIGVVGASYVVSRQLSRNDVVAVIVAVHITSRVLRFTFNALVAFLREILSDIATFPASLVVRRQYEQQEGETESNLCQLVITSFPIPYCPWSLESPDDLDFFEYADEPPSQLAPFVDALELPTSVWLNQSEDCVWKRFQISAQMPWLWLHTKLLACVLVGFVLIFYHVLFYIFHLQEIQTFSFGTVLASVLRSNLLGYAILHYWLHAYHRSTQRVCDRWAESFRRQGLLVAFCIQHEQRVNWGYNIFPKEKCYIQFCCTHQAEIRENHDVYP